MMILSCLFTGKYGGLGIMIDNIKGIINATIKYSRLKLADSPIGNEYCIQLMNNNYEESLYCPKCSDARQHTVEQFSNQQSFHLYKPSMRIEFTSLPVVWIAKCLQCKTISILVLYKGPKELELAVLHDTYGGCITEHTPTEVKYYIDQAYRAKSVNALTAAMSMYRSSLEWILYNQGFRDGMLGKKISDLEKAINQEKAPNWAMNMPTELLKAIKDIGNGAVHTNDGDIFKQQEIDKELIELVEVVFCELLDIIYEQPLKRKTNLLKLQSVAKKMKDEK